MEHQDAIKLIEKGIDSANTQRWADLGCGDGAFTMALAKLLSPGSQIFAYDLKHQNLPSSSDGVSIHFERLDFNKEQLPAANLDGILMANSLHYIKDKAGLIQRLNVPKFVIVEYERRTANPWVPYPITAEGLAILFNKLGYHAEKLMNTPSSFGGSIYSMVATKKG
jgi:SAM-dependent methyltransferase